MTITQLAERLGVGYSLARDLMHSCKPPVNFPSFCIGRTWVVDEAAYENWLERNRGALIPVKPHTKAKEIRVKKSHKSFNVSHSNIDFSKIDYYSHIKKEPNNKLT